MTGLALVRATRARNAWAHEIGQAQPGGVLPPETRSEMADPLETFATITFNGSSMKDVTLTVPNTSEWSDDSRNVYLLNHIAEAVLDHVMEDFEGKTLTVRVGALKTA
jgi:hypothetical protein